MDLYCPMVACRYRFRFDGKVRREVDGYIVVVTPSNRANTFSKHEEIIFAGPYFAIPGAVLLLNRAAGKKNSSLTLKYEQTAALALVLVGLFCTLNPQNIPENFMCPWVPVIPLIGTMMHSLASIFLLVLV